MIRLIKAEWYRLVHTGVLKYLILICFLFPVMAMMTDLNWYKMTLSENMALFAQNAIIMMPLFLGIAISISIGQCYQNKMAYYEIMDGRKTHEIILSKVILYNVIFVIGITVTCGVYFSTLGIINGVGDFSNIPLRFILVEITIIHVCTVSVLIYMLIKHIIGLVIVMLRFMFLDCMMVTLMTGINSSADSSLAAINSTNSTDWFVSGQMIKILSGDIDSKLILIVFATLIIEIAFWHILTHISYKHKMFN
ncbi:MAG: hypothetical protein ACI4M3_03765 [Acutalibacteraceae bacterium]